MRWIVAFLLLLGAHFALTALVPGPKALVYWPFGIETTPAFGLPAASLRSLTQILAVVAGLAFLLALMALFHLLVPAAWFTLLVIVGAAASTLLFVLYLGVFAVIPLLLNALLVYGVLALGWTVPMLRP